GSVKVRAVGTAFNVRLESGSVVVIVTEGKDQVSYEDSLRRGEAEDSPVLVSAGQRTLVSFARARRLARVSGADQIAFEARLAWQPRLLDVTNASLREIVAEFNHHNPVRVTLSDGSLGALRLSANFRSDNVEGFLRLMESDFGVRVERRGEGEILLTGSR